MTFTLLLKLARDMKAHKGQYIACFFVITLGLLLFSVMQGVTAALENAKTEFFARHRMADAFASVRSMPAGDIRGLNGLGGVSACSGRIVMDIRVTGFGDEKGVYLRVISAEGSPGDPLNGYMITRGAEPSGMEIAVGEGFFKAHGLSPGDTVTLIMNGVETAVPVSGTAQSPEYVYAISGGTNFMPDYSTFDIAYMPYREMSALLGMSENVNDVSFELSESFNDAAPELRDALKKYGLVSLYERDDQLSTAMLNEELKGLRAMSTSLPSMFLLITAIIVYMMVKRMVERQRPQIGVLKAFGYLSRSIQAHYSLYGLMVGLIGGLAGGLSGYLLSGPYIEMFRMYFSLPTLHGRTSPYYILYSILLAVPFCTLAALLAARGVMSLRPVEAFTPEQPPPGKKVLAERIGVVWRAFTTTGRMALRNMARTKTRVAFTSAGVMFSFAMCAMLFAFSGMMDALMINGLVRVQRYDAKITLKGLAPANDLLSEVSGVSNVDTAEPFLSVPLRVFSGSRYRDVSASGIEPGGTLYRLETSSRIPVALSEDGAVLTTSVAEKLGVAEGGVIAFYSPLLDRDESARHYVTVSQVIDQSLGEGVYFRRDALGAVFGDSGMANALLLSLHDPSLAGELSENYIKYPAVASVEDFDYIRRMYADMMAPYESLILAMVSIGILTGVAIVYNTAVITLSERSRELASMRVLGFTVSETVEVLTIEQIVCSILGIIAGVPLTQAMMNSMAAMYDSSLFSIPTYIAPENFVYATASVAVMILLAILAVRRKVYALDMVEALKSAE